MTRVFRRPRRGALLAAFAVLLSLAPSAARAGDRSLTVGLAAPRPAAARDQLDQGDARLSQLVFDAFGSELRAAGVTVTTPDSAPIELEVRYIRSGTRLTLIVTALERESSALLAGGVYLGSADLALVTAVRRAAERTASQLRTAAAVEAELPRPPVVLLRLTLRSPDEGSEILLDDAVSVGRIENGTLELPFVPIPLGSDLTIRQRQEGRYSATRVIPVTDTQMVVALPPLATRVDWEIAALWTAQRPAGAAVAFRRYITPERLYAQSTNQLATRYRFEEGSRLSGVFDTRLSFGGYLLAPRGRSFRVGAGAGLGVTLTTLRGEDEAYFFFDPYFNVLSLALRWQFARFAPFVQTDFNYYGDNSRGYLLRGTHTYLSVGVLLPWR